MEQTHKTYFTFQIYQHNPRQGKLGKARINDSKARRHEGTQGAQYSRLVGAFSNFVMVQRNLISF